MIDHAIYSLALGVQTHAIDIDGKLEDVDGNEMQLEAPNQVGQVGQYDIIELDTLLLASGTESLDMTGMKPTKIHFFFFSLSLTLTLSPTSKILGVRRACATPGASCWC